MWRSKNIKRILVLLHKNEWKKGLGYAIGSLIPYYGMDITQTTAGLKLNLLQFESS